MITIRKVEELEKYIVRKVIVFPPKTDVVILCKFESLHNIMEVYGNLRLDYIKSKNNSDEDINFYVNCAIYATGNIYVGGNLYTKYGIAGKHIYIDGRFESGNFEVYAKSFVSMSVKVGSGKSFDKKCKKVMDDENWEI